MNGINRKKLGDLLVDSGKITLHQLEGVLKKQKISGKRLGEILVEDNIVTEDDIIDVLEIQLGIQRVYLELISVDIEAVKLVPESLASKYNLIAVGMRDSYIEVVTSDPLNIFALDDVKIATGYEVEPMIASREEISRAIDKYYSTQFVEKAAEELSKQQSSKHISEKEDAEFDDVKNAPAVRLIDSIIKNAVKSRASDIHIEPYEKYIRIRYRIDGELQEVLRPSKETLPALVTRLKILSNLNIAEKRVPQDGRILTNIDDKEFDLRVSVLPTVHGEKVVIRILNREACLVDKKQLGLFENELEDIENIIRSPHGIILVTGPTGSGKSTTLYTLLRELNTAEKNIITVEDPVEFLMEGISQVNVNVKAGLTFAAGLRSILRQDPDIIMVGEIRDSETAEIAIRAAITGHLVLSTIHTNDAPSAVVRLMDMGIEPYLVATSISGVISQRLVKKICPHCSEEYTANEYEKQVLGIDKTAEIKLRRGKGCAYCNNTGYMGRIGVYEIMKISRKHREYIMNNKSVDELRDLSFGEGMTALRMSCARLVLEGKTAISELIKIAYLKE